MLEAAPPEPSDHWTLVALHAEIGAARKRLEVARRSARPADQVPLRQALVEALEAYASAVTSSGAPLPYRLRAEIDLYRGLGPRG